MEVILKDDIAGLGYKNDIVSVKAGYGRNYLVPQGMAMPANNTNRKVLDENLRQAAHKLEKMKSDATELAAKIGETVIKIATKAGESGKIFGAITPIQIADALKEKGFEIDRKRISIPSKIKEIGTHAAILDLHKEVKHEIVLEIITE